MPGTVFSGIYFNTVTLSNPAQDPATVIGLLTPSSGIAMLGLAGTAWSVVNQGSIKSTGTSAVGIQLASGGTVSNSALIVAGTKGTFIAGNTYVSGDGIAGIYVLDVPGTVTNTGSIAVYGTAGIGINLQAGGNVTNSGTIAHGTNGILPSGVGISLGAAGTVTNLAGGLIPEIFSTSGVSTVINRGSIGSSRYGINLKAGGLVSNASDGRISSGYGSKFSTYSSSNRGVVTFGDSVGTVLNEGSIFANGKMAVNVYAGGFISNAASGTISVYNGTAVQLRNGGTLFNQGSIGGSGFFGSGLGVNLEAGGLLVNAAGGIIGSKLSSGLYLAGVRFGFGAVTVLNAGTIFRLSGDSTYGPGAFVSNASTALITGLGLVGTANTVMNAGTMLAGNRVSGMLTNGAGGRIIGQISYDRGSVGLSVGAGTITNAGTIAGGSIINSGTLFNAVKFDPGATDRLIAMPGAVFTGVVDGGNTVGSSFTSTLELASGASQGTLSGLGTQYLNFGQTVIDTGAAWALTGLTLTSNLVRPGATLTNNGVLTLQNTVLTDAGVLQNNGTIVLDPSTLVAYSLTGSGMVTMDGSSTLAARGVVSSGQLINFAGPNALIKISDTINFAGTMTSFAQTDVIELLGFTATGSIYSSGTLTLSSAGGPASLSLPGAFTTDSFVVTTVSGNTDISLAPVCFCAGTRIATPDGERAVEQLRSGDQVVTTSGARREIVWIGRRQLDLSRHPSPKLAAPVRIRRGAFGSDLPRRDLLLSPNHAVFVDQMLIPVRLLINHTSIVREKLQGSVHYLHVELASHDILLAEGLPTESYLDAGDRAMFENAGDVVVLHPEFQSWTWEVRGYAPLLVTGPRLDAVRRQLVAHAKTCVSALEDYRSAALIRGAKTTLLPVRRRTTRSR